MLSEVGGVTIAHDTVRRLTERAGAVWRQLELELADALATAVSAAPAGLVPEPDPVAAERDVLLSLDGAMVPLVGGEWAEVRTLVVGSITPTPTGPTATALSSVSRICPAAAFGPSGSGELVRRGVPAHSGTVVAVSDGAVWIQELLDRPCPSAGRVLDLMHALEHLAAAAKAAFGPGTAATSEWLATRHADLKAGKLDHVLAQVAGLAASPERAAALRSLQARTEMLADDRFIAAGWPIGSGVVERATNVVVEARLKGAGMHWRHDHADALVGLRALEASDRWDAAWPRIVAAWRPTPRRRRPAPARPPGPMPDPVPPPARTPPAPGPPPTPHPKTIVAGKPTVDHPWKRRLLPPRPDRPPPSR